MPEPTQHTDDDILDTYPEPAMTSAIVDDVEVFAATDQFPLGDVSDLGYALELELDLKDES